MVLKKNIGDYTESEFLTFLKVICDADTSSEDEQIEFVIHFENITEHPKGSDLIYYPSEGEDDSPEGILNTVKEWRSMNGKSGFKQE